MVPATPRSDRTSLRGLAAAARAWAHRRQGDDRFPVRLAARRIYILPTRAAAAWGLVIAGVLLGGLNYGNSMALLLAFQLFGLAGYAMFACHRRLLGLTVTRVEALRCFAGEPLPVDVAIRAPDGTDARDIRVRVLAEGEAGPWACFEAGPQSADAAARPCAPATQRGARPLPALMIEVRAPFGFFRAWAWLHPAGEAVVWPRPAGSLPLPRGGGQTRGSRHERAGLDEWAGLRPFRDGDSPRQVAWKAYARGAPLLVREYHDPAGRECHLRYDELAALAPEARLSQLAAWILAADAAGEAWSMEIPGLRLPPGSGSAHRREALDALARAP